MLLQAHQNHLEIRVCLKFYGRSGFDIAAKFRQRSTGEDLIKINRLSVALTPQKWSLVASRSSKPPMSKTNKNNDEINLYVDTFWIVHEVHARFVLNSSKVWQNFRNNKNRKSPLTRLSLYPIRSFESCSEHFNFTFKYKTLFFRVVAVLLSFVLTILPSAMYSYVIKAT